MCLPNSMKMSRGSRIAATATATVKIDLLRYCGTDRLRAVAPLLIDASTRPFVTIQDYLCSSGSWLMNRTDLILLVLNGVADDNSLPTETKLCVNMNAHNELMINAEIGWILLETYSHST